MRLISVIAAAWTTILVPAILANSNIYNEENFSIWAQHECGKDTIELRVYETEPLGPSSLSGGFIIASYNLSGSEWQLLWGRGAGYIVDGKTLMIYQELAAVDKPLLMTLFEDEYGIWGAVHIIKRQSECSFSIQTIELPSDMHEDVYQSYDTYFDVVDSLTVRFNLVNDEGKHYIIRYVQEYDSLALLSE
jgi:hypothetical protein